MIGIIHIGAEKTGTTTLQETFFLNRDAFARAGVLYPGSPGARQHSLLAFYAMDDHRENLQTRRMPAEWTRDRAAWRAGFARQLEAEVAAAKPGHLLISTELFHSQVVDRNEVLRLKALLDRWCDRYRIVFYMRRQDRAQVSRYSTDLRTGGTPRSQLDLRTPGGARLHDYESVLGLWEDAFGRDSIAPRVFEASALRDGDLIADFVDAAGLPMEASTLARAPRRNSALSRTAQQFLLGYNRGAAQLAPRADRGRLQKIVAEAVEAGQPGAPSLPSRAEAMAFYEQFRGGNARVADKWFGGGPLFDEDFSDYPAQQSDDPVLDGADAAGIAAQLLRQVADNMLWLDAPRLERLLAAKPHNLLQVLAEFVEERSPELAQRLLALKPPPRRR